MGSARRPPPCSAGFATLSPLAIARCSVEGEASLGIVFPADLVHRFAPSFAGIETIGTVDDQTFVRSHVLVGMHHTSRNDDAGRLRCAGLETHPLPVGGRSGAPVPEIDAEIRGPHEDEDIGLVAVLV